MPSSSASASASAAATGSASASTKGSSKPSTFQPSNQLLTADFTATTQTVDGKPKGRNASGRNWKLRPQKRATTIVTKVSTNNRSKSWEKRKAEREAQKAAKEREKELREEMRQAAIAKKERRLENERRRAENEFKNAQKFAQNLGRHADTKMKAMSKKQLRQIKKTRMNNKTGVVEYVSPYAK
uniref:Coiled-coil domain-containing protein 86 n=1 Tax=Minutocellus polymorphus TaxID=265543 RepID=A0A7S0FS04_9STRA